MLFRTPGESMEGDMETPRAHVHAETHDLARVTEETELMEELPYE